MNKKRSNNKDMIDLSELSKEDTKFLSEVQYLVTLNIRSRRAERNTDTPKGFINFM